MNVSPRTVETFVDQLKIKLNVTKKSDFHNIVLENSLVRVMEYYFKYGE